MGLIAILGLGVPKDDSDEAGLSGDLDEISEDEKVEEPDIPIEEITEED